MAVTYLICKLYSAAGVIVIGGGLGVLGFGFAGVPSPEAAAVAEPPSFVFSLGAAALGFRFVAPESLGAAIETALSLPPSLSAVALRFGFAAGGSDALAALSLSFAAAGLAAALFFFSGLDSLVACALGAGGLVPV